MKNKKTLGLLVLGIILAGVAGYRLYSFFSSSKPNISGNAQMTTDASGNTGNGAAVGKPVTAQSAAAAPAPAAGAQQPTKAAQQQPAASQQTPVAQSVSTVPAVQQQESDVAEAGGQTTPDADSVSTDTAESGKSAVAASVDDGGEPVHTDTAEKPKNKSYFMPGRNHNPMMSPVDYDNIRKAEQARIDAEREAKLAEERAAADAKFQQQQKKLAAKKADPLVTMSKKIRLQGIMGNMALINNGSYQVGDKINGCPGCVLKTVGGNYIIVDYKGRTFRKVINMN